MARMLDEGMRGQILAGLREGRSVRGLAKDLDVGEATVRGYRDRWRDDGTLPPAAPETQNALGEVAPVPAAVEPGPASAGETPIEQTPFDEPIPTPGLDPPPNADHQALAELLATPERASSGREDTAQHRVNGGADSAPALAIAEPPVRGREDTSQPPPVGPPTMVTGGGPPLAAAGVVAHVIELNLQFPVELIATWRLAVVNGLELGFNDWIVHTIERHYAECLNLSLTLYRTQRNGST